MQGRFILSKKTWLLNPTASPKSKGLLSIFTPFISLEEVAMNVVFFIAHFAYCVPCLTRCLARKLPLSRPTPANCPFLQQKKQENILRATLYVRVCTFCTFRTYEIIRFYVLYWNMGNWIITKSDEAEMKKKIKIKTRVKMSKRYERAIKSGKGLCISCRRNTDSVFRQCLPQIGHALIFYPCYNDFIWFV